MFARPFVSQHSLFCKMLNTKRFCTCHKLTTSKVPPFGLDIFCNQRYESYSCASCIAQIKEIELRDCNPKSMDDFKFRYSCTFIIYHNIISIKSNVFFSLHKTYITRSCLCQNSVEIPSNRYNSMPSVNYFCFYYKASQFAISAMTSRVWAFHLSHQEWWSSSNLYASHNADWIMWLIQSMKGPAWKAHIGIPSIQALWKIIFSKNKSNDCCKWPRLGLRITNHNIILFVYGYRLFDVHNATPDINRNHSALWNRDEYT